MSLELRNSPIHGIGVFTTKPILRHSVVGNITIFRTITDDNPLDASKGEFYYHCHWYPDGEQVLLGKPYCYLNHACQPNIFYYTVNRSIYCLTMRDIAKDEELTLDYSLCNLRGQEWDCHCGSDNCRGHHRCGFGYLEHSRQMQLLPYLDPFIVAVHADAIQEILEKELHQ